MRKFPRSCFALLLLLLVPSRAFAEPHNSGAAIALDPSGIRIPFVVAPQPDSGALVLIQDYRNGIDEVFVQKLDRHGRPLFGAGGRQVWSAFGNMTVGNGIPDGSGGCLFSWTQPRGATGLDVLVQRVLADGSLAYGAGGLVVCNAAFDQSYPQLVPGPAGFYYVTWSDVRANVPNVSDIYIQKMSLAGTPQFAANGIAVNSTPYRPSQYYSPAAVADLLGGVLYAWPISAGGGVRAQRVSSAGALQWTASGVTVADPTDGYLTIAADGTGGLWGASVRYSGTYSPFAHHLTSTGASSFAPAGISIHSNSPNSFNIVPVRNASGGCFFYGLQYPTGPANGSNFFRQELGPTGSQLRGPDGEFLAYAVDQIWLYETASSVLLGIFDFELGPGKFLRLQRLAYDGTPAYPGLGIVIGRNEPTVREAAIFANATNTNLVFEVHADGRYCSPSNDQNYQGFGQAFDTAGNTLWDDAENPVISSAKDAPADQGGLVRVAYDASVTDSPAARVAKGYHGWRALGSVPPASLMAMHPMPDEPFAMGNGRYLVHANVYWEMVGQGPASQLPSYAQTLPTGQDSASAGPADESFMIEAYDDSSHHWYSNALTAHSVDNIAPVAPAPFTAQYAGGTAHLHWNPNAEPDIAGYRVYRGSSTSFVPGPGNLIASPPDTGLTDAAGAPAVYKISAVDVHGNESPYATVTPAGALGVDGGAPASLAFALVSRNPIRSGATLRMSLPAAAPVRVDVFDSAGREVRALANGRQAAGEWTIAWDGADAGGRAAPSGLYFARMETAGRSFAVRIVLTR